MASVVETIRNIFRIEELRQRIVFTALMLIVVRIGAHITIPGIDIEALKASTATSDPNNLFGLYDLFVGGAFSNAAIFAMGIMPYISASIILQLAGVFVPELMKLQREGEEGRRKINQWTRYLTVFVAAMQAIGLSIKLTATTAGIGGQSIVVEPGILFTLTAVATMTAGTIFLMWIGEQITERGIGNGISLIIFIGIISRLPVAIQNEIQLISAGARNWVVDLILVAFLGVIVALVVLVTQGARRIPIQYAKRIEGRKQYGGHTTYIPLRVNTAGVMPIIFASAILFIPNTILSFFPENQTLINIANLFSDRSILYAVLYAGLIIFFTYFYTAIAFNPRQVADDLKRAQGFIPGVRPGAPTAEYLDTILTRITLPGAVFLAIIALLPVFVTNVLNVPYSFAQFFGGTSLLIIVGVALDTLQQIEAYLLMRHYDGFMKSGRIRGRGMAISSSRY
ncbi:MAG: preprotein translocase subunit SecY [Bacteroidota bacterium]|nr:preprotein translocase subunit SecY [Candidatus Kapabacteria bacterium]MCS7302360.1 preprotein translocase subunit SecY [Candidatus Kapabacteria bacterium]MCX7936895.1 preprotein translocase subunit SecY [Chlorobiota bacterium]MDW8075326.1 preprotein translocase subunit SecY [Bacteroidota bacterium]MDW8271938.1 preprotein translocase subunit SecY [Bacteroidota bacterium]